MRINDGNEKDENPGPRIRACGPVCGRLYGFDAADRRSKSASVLLGNGLHGKSSDYLLGGVHSVPDISIV